MSQFNDGQVLTADQLRTAFAEHGILGREYGVVGDGTTDDTVALIAATSIAKVLGKSVYLSPGTYISSGLPAYAGMRLIGESSLTTIIKTKNGANAGLVTSPSLDINDILIQGIRFDGNRANNASGDTLTIKGAQPTLIDVVVTNSAGTGITTDWNPANASRLLGNGGHFERVIVDTTNDHGWIHNGASDSNFSDITIIDAGLRTDNTYYGFNAISNGRFHNLHYWNRWDTTNTPSVGVKLTSGGNNCVNCHFEGGHLPLSVPSNGNTLEGCSYYAPRGTYAASVTGVGNKIGGVTGLGYFGGNPNYIGLYLGGSGNSIDLVDVGSGNGAIDFGGSTGGNTVRIGGYRASGVAYVGTPNATDDVQINISGASGAKFKQEAPIPWSAYTPSIAPGTGSFTSTTTAGRGIKKGNTANVRITGTIAAAGLGTGTGALILGLPFTAGPGQYVLYGRETGVSGKMLVGTISPGGTTVSILAADNTSPLANNMQALMSGTYETA